MYPPQLPITSSSEITSGMHGQDVIRDNEVSLLPRVPVRDPAVMQEAVQCRAQGVIVLDRAVLILNRHICRVKGGLGLRPRLVVAQAWLARGRVVNDQRQPAELGRVKGRGAHAPGQLAQVVEVQVLGEVFEDQGGA